MTDNRTTEKLRKLLEERGIKWRETINHANCIFTWWESPTFGIVHAMDNEDGETLFMACLNSCDFTPEQAIAATLGSEREAELVRAMEDVLRHSTDTVWVGEAETLVDRMVSLGVYKHDVYEGVRPWEATDER